MAQKRTYRASRIYIYILPCSAYGTEPDSLLTGGEAGDGWTASLHSKSMALRHLSILNKRFGEAVWNGAGKDCLLRSNRGLGHRLVCADQDQTCWGSVSGLYCIISKVNR